MSPARLTCEYRAERPPSRSRGIRRALRVAWALAWVTMVLASLALAVATLGFHLVPLAVSSGSMEPRMPARSLIFVKEVDPGDVRVGDIITFDPPGRTARVTHRVITRGRVGARWYFQTKGDANPAPDDWRRGLAHPDRYRADVTFGSGPAVRHVATIPYAGWISLLGSLAWLRTALVLVPLTLIGISLLRAIWFQPDPTAA
jgi:signal peptidase I